MQYSDFLELNLLSNNDYASHWDVPVNENLTTLDAHLKELAEELITATSPWPGYIGQLSGGGYASLQERLDAISDPAGGGLIFNSDDLEKSRYSRKPWTVSDDIHARLQKLEEDAYLEDGVKGSIASGAGLIPFVKSRFDRVSGAGVKGRRYSDGTGTDLDNFYFRNADVSTLITHTGVNELTIDPLGLMQIGGNIYHHTRSCTVPVVDAGSHTYRIVATPGTPAATVDCQTIRTSAVTTVGGTFVVGGNTFNSAGCAAADVGNGDWQPATGQILRITYGADTYDYVIKTVVANDDLEIFGSFEIDAGGVPQDWEVLDLSQPCITITEVLVADVTNDAMTYMYAKTAAELVIAYVHVEGGNTRVTCPVQNGFINKSMLLPVTFYATGHIGPAPGGTVEDVELEGIAAANIKDIKVVTVERIYENLATDVFHYVTSINPKRLVTIAGAGDFFLDSCHVAHYGTIESDTGDQITNYGTIGPGAGGGTVIRLVHPDYGDDGAVNTYWAYDTSMVAAWPIDGYELMYCGILVELV